ncbi:MAG: hypothetical protein K2K19_10030, partial [Acetatifactor sp.]|nr:hypothetical protein [Acetatifactor sp.]
TVLVRTMVVATAGEGSHGGQDSAFVTYKTVTVGCISTGSHQCYVGGKLASCELYAYKYLNYVHCEICKAEGEAYYSYSITMHQYDH